MIMLVLMLTLVVEYVCACSVVSDSLQPHDWSPPASSVNGISHGKNTGVGCCFLLHGIFLTQELNLHLLYLLHWQADSLPIAPPGKPKPVLSLLFSHSVVSDSLRPCELQHTRLPCLSPTPRAYSKSCPSCR